VKKRIVQGVAQPVCKHKGQPSGPNHKKGMMRDAEKRHSQSRSEQGATSDFRRVARRLGTSESEAMHMALMNCAKELGILQEKMRKVGFWLNPRECLSAG